MTPNWRVWCCGSVTLLAMALALVADEKPLATRKIDFVKDVQPIFEAKCLACHGAKKQESAYRLDHKASALRGGDLGRAIVPGKSGESPLIRYVAGLGPDIKMPPEGERLSSAQIAILRAWIDQGADWPESASIELKSRGTDHWAFKACVRPAVPNLRPTADSRQPIAAIPFFRTPIDNFIVARLQREGLTLSSETDRITWLRRVSLDLIGLPPTIDEVDAFVADPSPDAFEKQVERLLASPHYGERWARHWLDAARYADSDGFEKDKSRQTWFYRDWVVNALNRDLGYDHFLIEQLAGDLLPNATQDQVVATGFLRNSMLNEEGGVDPEQFRMDAMFDRMEAVGKAMLGLTIQCAQCHDHKFDPLTQRDYYRLFAFLNNDHEAQSVVYSEAERMQIADIRREINDIEEELRRATPDWQQRLAEWEVSGTGGLTLPARQEQGDWTTLQLTHIGDNGQRYFDQGDGSILVAGYAPTKFAAVFQSQPLDLKNITAIRIELLNDPNLPCNGPGRSFMGTCALTEISVEADNAGPPAANVTRSVSEGRTPKQPVKLVSATADYGNPERVLEANFFDKTDKRRVTGPVAFAIDGKDDTAWGIDAGPGRRNQPRNAVFVFDKPVSYENGTVLKVTLKQNHGGWNSDDHMNNNLGRFRLSVTSAKSPTADPVPVAVRTALTVAREQRSPAQQAAIFSYWRTTVAEFASFNDRIGAAWHRWPSGSTQLVLMPREKPRETRILARGDFLKPTRIVESGVPEFLSVKFLKKNNGHRTSAFGFRPDSRLAFAQWLTDRSHPTTARVIVNRVWQAYFGTGLVSTSEDFGTQAEPPSHPELLDWLAVEFMEHNWSLKHLHRLITSSATYRQSSRVTPELYERDQFNRLLARFPRQRVEGEIVRDIALAASGLLNEKLSGPAIFSPSPAFLYQPPASYGPFTWTEETGAERYRRGLYTFRRRSTPYPMLTNFDTPNADAACVKRTRSNTPLQALTTLNEVVFFECAQALASLILSEGGSDDSARLTFAFRRCVSRDPSDAERTLLLKLLNQQRTKVGQPELAWTVVARVLLNLDETVTRE
ncbi:MAG: PSD1 and planctomycete cytochrome C domain-containing protein [Planctomycetaceae bacterium]